MVIPSTNTTLRLPRLVAEYETFGSSLKLVDFDYLMLDIKGCPPVDNPRWW